MSEKKLRIAVSKLGVYFIYAGSPGETFTETRERVPALKAVSIYDFVDEDEQALRDRFPGLIEPGVTRPGVAG